MVKIKGLLKNLMIKIHPNYYLRIRAERAGHFEKEIKLLKYLCDLGKTSLDIGASLTLDTVIEKVCKAIPPFWSETWAVTL